MSNVPRVFLATPTYDDTMHIGCARALYDYPTEGGVEIIGGGTTGSSLLARTFNTILGLALDARDRGDCTHLAMLHADVAPGRAWLDTLAAEMARVGADLISAVIPIKEPTSNPRTSTAIGSLADPWHPLRYLHTDDRERLPATFSRKDVCKDDGEVLLVNTGCMLANLVRPWWDTFAFGILDRIVVGPDGRRVAQTRPEDWEMSRHLHAAGAKVFATWTVDLHHYGKLAWPNR